MAGLRYNEGKNRLDLIPVRAVEEIGKVFTFGSKKYEPRNWERGMEWSKVLASLKRHIAAFESGEDFDKESGLYHLAHAGCNVMFLLEYYKTHPEFDDRPHSYLSDKRIGLDIDGVLADFITKYIELHGGELHGGEIPTSYEFDYWFKDKVKDLDKDFWLSLPLYEVPPFDPVCYISNRTFDVDWTKEWIMKVGLPAAPVIHTKDKVEAARQFMLDIYVDDSFEIFKTMNKAGVCTFLMDAPYNNKFEVGYKRIHTLKDI